MKRSLCFLAALACVSSAGVTARAGVLIKPPPGPARIANADVVIVGKVDMIEPQDVKVGNINYRIAVVKISEAVRGIKEEKTVRVGFIPIEKPKPMVIVTGGRPVQLEAGQEGLFLLKKLDKETFYTIPGVVGYYFNSAKNDDFAKEVQAAKSAAKIADNPQAGLKSKDADARLAAAAVLVEKYRTYRGPKATQEPIDAEESKLIMKALADADWQQTNVNFASLQFTPDHVFQRLGVTAKDGFAPAPGAKYQAAAHTWVRENADKYRIQRFVAGDTK